MEKPEYYADPKADKEFPRWYFGPGGREAEFASADDVPEGWVTHPSELPAEEAPAIDL
jgi:hypothetical protein